MPLTAELSEFPRTQESQIYADVAMEALQHVARQMPGGADMGALLGALAYIQAHFISGIKDRRIEALRAALEECAAPWMSPPTTVMGAAQYLSEEFQRRMNMAGAALSQEEADPGVGAGMDGAHVGFARALSPTEEPK